MDLPAKFDTQVKMTFKDHCRELTRQFRFTPVYWVWISSFFFYALAYQLTGRILPKEGFQIIIMVAPVILLVIAAKRHFMQPATYSVAMNEDGISMTVNDTGWRTQCSWNDVERIEKYGKWLRFRYNLGVKMLTDTIRPLDCVPAQDPDSLYLAVFRCWEASRAKQHQLGHKDDVQWIERQRDNR